MRLIEKIENEGKNLKKDIRNDAGFLVWFVIALIFMLVILFGDRSDAFAEQKKAENKKDISQAVLEFDPDLPPQELVIPWKIERLTFKGSEFQNEVVNYANSLGGKDFALTLVSENGTLDPNRRSECVQKDGKREPSYGLCQLHMAWHKPFITSPEFKDWRKQVAYCLEVFEKRPGAFYGYYKRARALKSFI